MIQGRMITKQGRCAVYCKQCSKTCHTKRNCQSRARLTSAPASATGHQAVLPAHAMPLAHASRIKMTASKTQSHTHLSGVHTMQGPKHLSCAAAPSWAAAARGGCKQTPPSRRQHQTLNRTHKTTARCPLRKTVRKHLSMCCRVRKSQPQPQHI